MPLPAIAIRFEGNETCTEAVELAQKAEKAGASSVWITQHLGRRDPAVLAAGILSATRSIRVAIQNLTPFINHPFVAAMALATLAEHGCGRVAASLGIGNPLDLARAGTPVMDGEAVLERALRAVATMLRGEAASGDAGIVNLDRCQLDRPSRCDLYASVLHPGLVVLAGRAGVGVQLSAGLSTPFMRACLAAAPAGPVTAFAYLVGAGQDRRAVRRKLAYLFRNDLLADNVDGAGLGIDQPAIRRAIADGDLDRAEALVPDEAVAHFALTADGDGIETLRGWRAMGVDEVAVDLGSDRRGIAAGLDFVRQARP